MSLSLGQAEGTPAIVMHLLCAGHQVGALDVSSHSSLTSPVETRDIHSILYTEDGSNNGNFKCYRF